MNDQIIFLALNLQNLALISCQVINEQTVCSTLNVLNQFLSNSLEFAMIISLTLFLLSRGEVKMFSLWALKCLVCSLGLFHLLCLNRV